MTWFRISGQAADISLELELLTEAIAPFVSELYWLIEADFVYDAADGTVFDDWKRRYNDLVIDSDEEYRVVGPGFFPTYAKFVLPDWTTLIGSASLPTLPESDEDLAEAIRESDICIQCIDAAFWRVRTSNETILREVLDRFPDAVAMEHGSSPPAPN